MATMKDVAQRAGVSASTVSHIINGTRYVSPELTEAVISVIEDLDYRPYGLARSLRTKQSRTVGVLIPDNTNPYFAEIARLLEDVFFSHGYNVIVCNTEQNPDKELTYLRLLQEKAVDAMVFVSTGGDAGAIETIRRQQIPCVLLDRDVHGLNLDRVIAENEPGAYMATRHLIDRGHRRIGMIAGPKGIAAADSRLVGYERAMNESSLPTRIVQGDFQLESGYLGYRELRRNEPALTAVFAANDLMALGVLHGAAEDGVRCPKDLSVVGFDDIQLASYAVPALTTVRQPKDEIVNHAVNRLLLRIGKHPRQEPTRASFVSELIVRKSTARAAPEHGAPAAASDETRSVEQ